MDCSVMLSLEFGPVFFLFVLQNIHCLSVDLIAKWDKFYTSVKPNKSFKICSSSLVLIH